MLVTLSGITIVSTPSSSASKEIEVTVFPSILSGIKTVCELGVSLYQAVRMATLTPARIVHMEERFGSLEVGKDADIVVFTKDYQTIMTMIQGNIVYRRNS